MCVVAICKGRRIPKDEFDEAFKCNKDGAGMAWRENGKIRAVKGLMKVEDAWTAYNKFIVKGNFPHVVHFRLGSPVTQDLTHPFIINEESDLVLNYEGTSSVMFHNGIVSQWKNLLFPWFMSKGKIVDGEWSDTRLIACLYNKMGEGIFDYIDGKFIIFGTDSVKTIGKFEEDNNILWSNNSYKVSTWYRNGGQQYLTSGVTKHETPTKNIEYGHFGKMEDLGKCMEFYI
jgi:hypothetical protein